MKKVDPYLLDADSIFAEMRATLIKYAPTFDAILVIYDSESDTTHVISNGGRNSLMGEEKRGARVALLRKGIEATQEPDYYDTVRSQ